MDLCWCNIIHTGTGKFQHDVLGSRLMQTGHVLTYGIFLLLNSQGSRTCRIRLEANPVTVMLVLLRHFFDEELCTATLASSFGCLDR